MIEISSIRFPLRRVSLRLLTRARPKRMNNEGCRPFSQRPKLTTASELINLPGPPRLDCPGELTDNSECLSDSAHSQIV